MWVRGRRFFNWSEPIRLAHRPLWCGRLSSGWPKNRPVVSRLVVCRRAALAGGQTAPLSLFPSQEDRSGEDSCCWPVPEGCPRRFLMVMVVGFRRHRGALCFMVEGSGWGLNEETPSFRGRPPLPSIRRRYSGVDTAYTPPHPKQRGSGPTQPHREARVSGVGPP